MSKKKTEDFAEAFRVVSGSKFRLAHCDPDNTLGIKKADSEGPLAESLRRLDELQGLLYAEGKRAVLVVLQGMDAGGKDGTIRHVMSGMNPQSCRVQSFGAPTPEELAHDFLWRIHRAVPKKGEVGIFNRSQYEDVLIVRVHNLVAKSVWSRRYEQINTFEDMLSQNGVHVLKFFLHISQAEQLDRLKQRIKDPARQWKISQPDLAERKYWDDYQQAYEDAIGRCSTQHAPWYVIPANHKWFRNLAISTILANTLEGFGMKYPSPRFDLSKVKVK